MDKRWMVIGIFILLFGVNIDSSYARDIEAMSLVYFDGTTLYVGGVGPNNYTKIQDAIDNASDGDTVFVYSGDYNEHIIVHKEISLFGQNKETTIINSTDINDLTVLIPIGSNRVILSDFTIKNDIHDEYGVSIYICSNHNIIENNIICNREGIIIDEYSENNSIVNNSFYTWVFGIALIHSEKNVLQGNTISDGVHGAIGLEESSNNIIVDNEIINNYYGIFLLESSHNNLVSNNTISSKHEGIGCSKSDYNTISSNVILDNDDFGISLDFTQHCIVQFNTFDNNGIGIGVYYSLCTEVNNNNFYDNEKDASWQNSIIQCVWFPWKNRWDSNYWGEPIDHPKAVPGYIFCGAIGNLPIDLPWFQIDWHPAQEPYDI